MQLFRIGRSWDFRKGHPKTGYGLRVAGLMWECLPIFWFTPFSVDIYFTSRILANLNLHGNKKYYLSLLRRYTVNISTDSKYAYFYFRVHICHDCCQSSSDDLNQKHTIHLPTLADQISSLHIQQKLQQLWLLKVSTPKIHH